MSEVTAAHKKVYPRHIEGRFHTVRGVISAVLQALLFVAPWINWRGQQAILIDVAGRRLFIYDLVLHPQETYFLLLLLIIGALLLFTTSALSGRMWCGYACPQTLFTGSFVAVERFFEGDRAQRLRLDRRPWDLEKLRIKLGKLSVWTAMGVWLGLTFAGYYVSIRELAVDMASGHPTQTSLIVIACFTAFSLFDFGWFREQFCSYLCPYARFQGAMLDPESRIVAYDVNRGEPRGKAKAERKGDCVDCTMCVQACPMGIDIRKGLQLECIACASCVDACDDVMDKLGRAPGLIRYTSLQELEGRPTHIVRPRLVIYIVLLTLLIGLFFFLLAARGPLAVTATRQAPGGGENFSIAPDGRISNSYRIHLMNHTRRAQEVSLGVDDFPGAELITNSNPYLLEPGEVATLTAVVLHPREGLRLSQRLKIRAQSGAFNAEKETNFLAPYH